MRKTKAQTPIQKNCLLGIDIAAQKCDWCLFSLTKNEIEAEGSLSLSEFAAWVKNQTDAGIKIEEAAAEYTGGLALPFLEAISAAGITAYIINTNTRKAYQKIAGTTTKTDKEDARLIVRTLAIWRNPDMRRAAVMKEHIFQPFQRVTVAWTLRDIMGDYRRATKDATAAANRAAAARHAGKEARAAAWERIQKSNKIFAEEFFALVMSYAQEHYGKELELLQTIPQVGEKSAVLLLACLMPLERFQEQQDGRDKMRSNICAYVGFMPNLQQSGGRILKNTHFSGGYRELKSVLVTAASGAATKSSTNAAGHYYRSLIAQKKIPRQARYLTGKKLLLWSIGVLRSGERFVDPFKPVEPEKPALPGHLISASDAAVLCGIKRSTLWMRTKAKREALRLSSEEWEGVLYFLRSEIEALQTETTAQNKAIASEQTYEPTSPATVRTRRKKKGDAA